MPATKDLRRREDSSGIDRRTANAGTCDESEGVSRFGQRGRLDRCGLERGDAGNDGIGDNASRQMLEHFALGTIVIGRMGGTAGDVRASLPMLGVSMAVGCSGGNIALRRNIP
jgi:hypothetical protein